VHITAITGVSFAPVLKAVLARLKKVHGASIRLITVKNSLFGPSVTVAGLLAGRDILNSIKGKRLGSLLLIPATSLKDDEGLFIDDMKLSEVEAAAGIPVKTVSSFSDLVGLLKASGKRHVQRRGS
jgi:NifB/MoaA-like Fe-S oxidoreductase